KIQKIENLINAPLVLFLEQLQKQKTVSNQKSSQQLKFNLNEQHLQKIFENYLKHLSILVEICDDEAILPG
ncbi:MAG: hypothetical protein AAGF26_10450, partial [Cyanobacteria bacterium P01_G01_bin.49]